MFADTNEPVFPKRDCSGCDRGHLYITVNIPEDMSHNGLQRWENKPIDYCCVPIVRALVACGVLTRTSCCGHGKGPGRIVLQDGTKITIDWRGEP